MKVDEVTLYRVKMPLDRPYPLSFNSVDMAAFDAIVAEVRDTDGRSGWGEVTILPVYTHETVESGWQFGLDHGARLVGKSTLDAKRQLIAQVVEPLFHRSTS